MAVRPPGLDVQEFDSPAGHYNKSKNYSYDKELLQE